MVYKFTNRAEKAIAYAEKIAAEFGHNYVGTEHLMIGIFECATDNLRKSFKSFEAWDALIHFIDNKLDSNLKNLLYVKQQKALAYNQKKNYSDIQTSIVLLQEILREQSGEILVKHMA